MAKKILIMEDEKTLQGLLKDKLVASGYEVLAVDDGEAGMQVLQEYNPDLILLDMMMPKMDGFAVLEKMKLDNLTDSFPVIVISNSGQPVEIERALSLGIKDYIIKVDFDPVEVLEKVNNFFKLEQNKNVAISEEGESSIQPSQTAYSGDGGLEAEVASMNKSVDSEKSGVKVLLVEDDDFLRGICEHKLSKEGFNVSISADGQDALNKIKAEDFQLILLDVILPNMNGFEILEEIKKDPVKSRIPVIMLTNMGQESEVKKGFDLGATDYIIKAHFTVEEIVKKIEETIIRKNIRGSEISEILGS